MRRMAFGLVAAASLALVLSGCPTDSNPGGSGLGDTPTLSGRMYEEVMIFGFTLLPPSLNMAIRYDGYNGNHTVTSNLAGRTGTITDGQLSIQLGIPADNELSAVSATGSVFDGWGWTGVTANPADARFANLTLNVGDDEVRRVFSSMSVTGMTVNASYSTVHFVYVDRDVTIRGTGMELPPDEDDFFPFSTTTESFDLPLRRGWNALHIRLEGSGNPFAGGVNATMTLSVGEPNNIRWVFGDTGLDGELPNLPF